MERNYGVQADWVGKAGFKCEAFKEEDVSAKTSHDIISEEEFTKSEFEILLLLQRWPLFFG